MWIKSDYDYGRATSLKLVVAEYRSVLKNCCWGFFWDKIVAIWERTDSQVLVSSPNKSKLIKCHPFWAAFCDCSTALFHQVICQFVWRDYIIWGFYFGVFKICLYHSSWKWPKLLLLSRKIRMRPNLICRLWIWQGRNRLQQRLPYPARLDHAKSCIGICRSVSIQSFWLRCFTWDDCQFLINL